jgi:hypothetical protein
MIRIYKPIDISIEIWFRVSWREDEQFSSLFLIETKVNIFLNSIFHSKFSWDSFNNWFNSILINYHSILIIIVIVMFDPMTLLRWLPHQLSWLEYQIVNLEIVRLSHTGGVLFHCFIVSSCYCFIIWQLYCVIVSLFHSVFALLCYCVVVLLNQLCLCRASIIFHVLDFPLSKTDSQKWNEIGWTFFSSLVFVLYPDDCNCVEKC